MDDPTAHLAFGMRTRMNDSVHVEIQIVELLAVGIRAGGVDGLERG